MVKTAKVKKTGRPKGYSAGVEKLADKIEAFIDKVDFFDYPEHGSAKTDTDKLLSNSKLLVALKQLQVLRGRGYLMGSRNQPQ